MSYGLRKIRAAELKEMLLGIFEQLKQEALSMNRPDLIEKYSFPSDWSYRRIDKKTAAFQAEIEALKAVK